MRTTNVLRALPALALATTFATTPVLAETPDAIPPVNNAEVRVVNNHEDRVAVFAVADDNERVYLGSVNRTRFKSFTLPAGTVRLQVLPRTTPAGLGARSSHDTGIETRQVTLQGGQAIQLWLEPGLADSTASLLGD